MMVYPRTAVVKQPGTWHGRRQATRNLERLSRARKRLPPDDPRESLNRARSNPALARKTFADVWPIWESSVAKTRGFLGPCAIVLAQAAVGAAATVIVLWRTKGNAASK
jgi:hypothetical protein